MVKGIPWPGAFVPCAVVTHVSAVPQTAVHHPIRGLGLFCWIWKPLCLQRHCTIMELGGYLRFSILFAVYL